MAVLPDSDRQRVANGLMRYFSSNREQTPGITKSDIRNAVNSTDAWIDSNQANWNAGLPAPVKNNFTSNQKSLLFCAVVLMRAGINLLRTIFGEVD